MVVFTSILITILFQYLNQPFTGEGELEAQEAYLYSQMVESWGIPPDIDLIKTDIKNINLNQINYRRCVSIRLQEQALCFSW